TGWVRSNGGTTFSRTSTTGCMRDGAKGATGMATGSSADGVSWDLKDLYAGVDDPQLTRDLETALKRAEAFEATYRGKIVAGPEPADLRTAVVELESLYERMTRPAVYAQLLHAAKTDDPRHGALLSRTREQRTVINKHLIFFDLEWIQVDDARARALIESPQLA